MRIPAESNLQLGVKQIVPRYPFEARIKIRIDRTSGAVECEGWARDLSESGLGAFVATPIDMGEPVTLKIPIAHGLDLVIPANVTRILGTQYGFQFTALSGQQRDHILRVLAGKKAILYQPTLG